MGGILGVHCCRKRFDEKSERKNGSELAAIRPGGGMKLLLLSSLILIFPAVSLATSIDYASKGSVGAGTATFKGDAKVGSSVVLTSPLIDINSVSATGTVTLATGTLAATSNPNVFDFTGGSITILSSGNTLFHGAFSSGTITLLSALSFSFSGMLNNGAAFTTQIDKHGDVQGDTIVTPELGTLGLMTTGIGLIGLAGIARRKQRGLPRCASLSAKAHE
jgi:hypothetical protein